MTDISQLVDGIHLSLIDCKTTLKTNNLYYLAYGLAILDNRFKYYQLIIQNENFVMLNKKKRKLSAKISKYD